MSFIADLHIHSRYSRATSKDMNLDGISQWAKLKGIKLMGTGDITHPEWLKELKSKLKDTGDGLYKYQEVYFILSGEVSNIYSWKGEIKKIHNLILSPSFEDVERINEELKGFGNLSSDGRPILSLEVAKMMEIINRVSPYSVVIPAHVWTPHFSLFGANSGFDRIEDCFHEWVEKIPALETGLSSDPPMNWRWSTLDRFRLVSNSDAHSPSRIGREANILECNLTYRDIVHTLFTGEGFLATIEFFPQEGKYHYDGHRKCGVCLSPKEAILNNNLCPVCGGILTIGVMHRVEELADREEGFVPPTSKPYHHLIPLEEIIAEALGMGREAQQVRNEYLQLVGKWGGEIPILLYLEEEILREHFPSPIAKRILAVRKGMVEIRPGYDGVYGEIKIKVEEEKEDKSQLTLF